MNPEVSSVNVPGTTPTLVFSGTGKVLLRSVNGNVRFGDISVDAANSATWLSTTAAFNFCAPAEVYAVCINSAVNQLAVVEVWY